MLRKTRYQPGPLAVVAAYDRLRVSARRALPALIGMRDSLIECHSLLDEKGKPRPGTCDAAAARDALELTQIIDDLCAHNIRRRP